MSRITFFKFLTVIILLNFMSSCGSSDGAPRRYMSYSSVPDAIPKVEKLSSKVNPSSYKVLGKRYYVLKSSEGYDKVGTASWYGTKFHGKLTSTGEKYDMHSMSAANKELPIPCYVEVTNLKNKRKVVVKVNDRGPFVDNRIIDLSYAAAQKLGVVATGTAKVRVRAINPKKRFHYNNIPNHQESNLNKLKKLVQKEKPKRPPLFLQISVHKDEKAATELQRKILKEALFLTKVETLKTANNSINYRVKVGPFVDFETATAAREFLTKNKFATGITFVKS
ncbi:MAG: septal ring lytic transglycosylase RlpA family protein [Pseudomonadota bacterium]|nr:septal ring lytic transglycosylase RlpA family protein [Pseudomonadota bacterium]